MDATQNPPPWAATPHLDREGVESAVTAAISAPSIGQSSRFASGNATTAASSGTIAASATTPSITSNAAGVAGLPKLSLPPCHRPA